MAKNKFAEIVSTTRKRRGLSQKQAAAEMGVTQALLSHYENGVRECNLDFLVTAADYYGVTCDYLLGHSTTKIARTASAQRQRSFVRILETVMLLIERSEDELLREQSLEYIKKSLYRLLKFFDGVAEGLRFEGDDFAADYIGGSAEMNYALARQEAENIKDMDISLHESSMEYLTTLIEDVEQALPQL